MCESHEVQRESMQQTSSKLQGEWMVFFWGLLMHIHKSCVFMILRCMTT
jgi:hypothetical protein